LPDPVPAHRFGALVFQSDYCLTPTDSVTARDSDLQRLARRRWRVAITLTAAVIAVYFGFILLIAFNKPFMGSLITPGLSVGILLGALVIVATWLLTWYYVRWANEHYDRALDEIRKAGRP